MAVGITIAFGLFLIVLTTLMALNQDVQDA